jgi:hypothetical protein
MDVPPPFPGWMIMRPRTAPGSPKESVQSKTSDFALQQELPGRGDGKEEHIRRAGQAAESVVLIKRHRLSAFWRPPAGQGRRAQRRWSSGRHPPAALCQGPVPGIPARRPSVRRARPAGRGSAAETPPGKTFFALTLLSLQRYMGFLSGHRRHPDPCPSNHSIYVFVSVTPGLRMNGKMRFA